jgi:hypothetical protein
MSVFRFAHISTVRHVATLFHFSEFHEHSATSLLLEHGVEPRCQASTGPL